VSAEIGSDVAERFRQLRDHLNFSQRDFAREIGVSPSVISEIERGGREPSRKVFSTIHDKFGCDLNWLLLGDGALDTPAPNMSAKERENEELKKSIAEM
jgi:transcriptional regulator with XRE-family HTH domain